MKKVCVLGLPALADALSRHAPVVTGTDWKTSALAIKEAADAGDAELLLVVADTEWPSSDRWITAMSSRFATTVVRLEDGTGTDFPDATVIEAPVAIEEVMTSLGGAKTPVTIRGLILWPDGTLSADPPVADEEIEYEAADDPQAISEESTVVVPQTETTQSDQGRTATQSISPFDFPALPPEVVDEASTSTAEVPPRIRPEPSAPVAVLERDIPALIEPQPLEAPPPVVASIPGGVAPDMYNLGGAGGHVVLCSASKGGVSKSSSAVALAQRAALRGKKVILIDGNVGQGDLRGYLRIPGGSIPSIVDVAASREVAKGIAAPSRLNQVRPDGLEELRFAFIAAPTADQAAVGRDIAPDAYLLAVQQARAVADLIVVDTQIIEVRERGSATAVMVEEFLEPLLVGGAYGLMLSDASGPSIGNLLWRLRKWAAEGVGRSRLFSALSRIYDTEKYRPVVENAAKSFSEHSKYVGTIFEDESIPMLTSRGNTTADHPVYVEVLDAVLRGIFGESDFPTDANLPSPDTGRKRGKFALLGRRK